MKRRKGGVRGTGGEKGVKKEGKGKEPPFQNVCIRA